MKGKRNFMPYQILLKMPNKQPHAIFKLVKGTTNLVYKTLLYPSKVLKGAKNSIKLLYLSSWTQAHFSRVPESVGQAQKKAQGFKIPRFRGFHPPENEEWVLLQEFHNNIIISKNIEKEKSQC